MIQMAIDRNICLLTTPLPMFTSCGLLFEAGLRGGPVLENSIMSLKYTISPADFTRAGEASSDVKNKLKKLDVPPAIVRKVAIAMYEGEINMVIHANGGEITVDITPESIIMQLKDVGRELPILIKPCRPAIPLPRIRSVLWALALEWGFPI